MTWNIIYSKSFEPTLNWSHGHVDFHDSFVSWLSVTLPLPSITPPIPLGRSFTCYLLYSTLTSTTNMAGHHPPHSSQQRRILGLKPLSGTRRMGLKGWRLKGWGWRMGSDGWGLTDGALQMGLEMQMRLGPPPGMFFKHFLYSTNWLFASKQWLQVPPMWQRHTPKPGRWTGLETMDGVEWVGLETQTRLEPPPGTFFQIQIFLFY